MNAFLVTFQAVAALLGIGFIGFWIIGRRNIPGPALALLTSIAIDITLPCLALGNLLINFNPQSYPQWWRMPVWFFGFQGLALLLSWSFSFIVSPKVRGEFSLSLFLQNGIFFPLIIIAGLFPHQQAGYVVTLFLFTMIQPSVAFTSYPYFFHNPTAAQRFDWSRIFNPVLVATLIGIAFGLLRISRYVPEFATMILTFIGAMAIPLFMLILGGNVYNDFKQGRASGRGFYWAEIGKFVLVKNILFPALFLGILVWLKPDYPLAFIIILQAAVPPITAIPIFTERSGGNRAITSQFIVASFIASILTIPSVFWAFTRFFPFPG